MSQQKETCYSTCQMNTKCLKPVDISSLGNPKITPTWNSDWIKRFICKNRTNQFNMFLFSDEAWFYLQECTLNSQNTFTWAKMNPHPLHKIPL